MGTVFHVDFKNKTLIEKKEDVEAKVEPPTSSTANMIATDKVSKKEYFQQLIDAGKVQIFVNTKARGLKIPSSLKSEPMTAFNWSYKFRIPDFVFDAKGVRGSLLFNSSSFFVEVPWKSVWAIFLANNPKETMKIWEEDVPAEISLQELMQSDK